MARLRQPVLLTMLGALAVGVMVYKLSLLHRLSGDLILYAYGATAGAYVVSRVVLSLAYRLPPDQGVEPSVALVMPAFNEQDAIGPSLRSLLTVDYPEKKLQIVAVDDGSTDDTLAALWAVADLADGRVKVISFPQNRGKRAAMAAGIRATNADVIAFVDSDSILATDAVRKIVQPFARADVGAVCGHADVLNRDGTWLAKMQAVRYCYGFKVLKAAESVFGAVTCCSGCFSAYRREAIVPWLAWWEDQRFMGRPATIGDDRSLTNCVLRSWRCVYHADAVSHTIVPATLRAYVKQQTRWKRSWTRESMLIGKFIWRKHPAAACATYVSMALPLAAPVCLVRLLSNHSVVTGQTAIISAVALLSTGLFFSLYYAVRTPQRDRVWMYGMTFIFVYLGLLMWLTYYAIGTCRSGNWGTRKAKAGAPARRRTVVDWISGLGLGGWGRYRVAGLVTVAAVIVPPSTSFAAARETRSLPTLKVPSLVAVVSRPNAPTCLPVDVRRFCPPIDLRLPAPTQPVPLAGHLLLTPVSVRPP